STEDKGAVSYSAGTAVFTTDHFSSYAVYTAKTSEQPGGGTGGSGGSGSGSGSSTEEGFSAGSAQGTPSQDHAGTKAVKTGDTNNLTLILLLLSASLAAGCAGMAVRKKK
ncbi:MAG TPA: LPXTG cell wall anchor domain-containing protein, partial [Lachnoclostridium phocaeense]|nr:LPXTG cell wall anchor domain-containing protein [Lachnoclostridium phocaeense]